MSTTTTTKTTKTAKIAKKAAASQRSPRAHVRTIGEVMTDQPYTIGRDQKLSRAHEMMREHKLRHLPVLEHGQLVGVLTQRDLYFLETISGVSIDEDHVDDAMSPDAYAVSPDTPLGEVAETMLERKLGCAVIVERDRVAGIFTATDALKLIAQSERGSTRH